MSTAEVEKAWDEAIDVFMRAIAAGKPRDELVRIWRRITILSDILSKAKFCNN